MRRKARQFLLLVLLPVMLSSSGEFFLKFAVNQKLVKEVAAITEVVTSEIPQKESRLKVLTQQVWAKVLGNSFVIIGIGLNIMSGLLWLVAMSHYELSFLYPFLSLNFLIVTLGSQLILGESVSLYRYMSVVLIIIGLVIISRSPHAEDREAPHASKNPN